MRLALLLACVLWAPEVFAQALTISSPGAYTLTGDLSDVGTVIQVNASDVSLFLNGKTVRCTPSNPGTAVTTGIAASGRSNVSIIGPGSVTGCFFGMQLAYGAKYLVDDVTISGNTYIGINAGYGHGHVLKRITCASIGGFLSEAYAICINGVGVNSRVEDTTMSEIYRQAGVGGIGEGVGVLVEVNATGVLLKNVSMENATEQPNTIGVWVAAGASVQAENVSVTRFASPVSGTGAYAVVTPPPPPPPPSGGRWFRICVDNRQTCYEGLLPLVPGL